MAIASSRRRRCIFFPSSLQGLTTNRKTNKATAGGNTAVDALLPGPPKLFAKIAAAAAARRRLRRPPGSAKAAAGSFWRVLRASATVSLDGKENDDSKDARASGSSSWSSFRWCATPEKQGALPALSLKAAFRGRQGSTDVVLFDEAWVADARGLAVRGAGAAVIVVSDDKQLPRCDVTGLLGLPSGKPSEKTEYGSSRGGCHWCR